MILVTKFLCPLAQGGRLHMSNIIWLDWKSPKRSERVLTFMSPSCFSPMETYKQTSPTVRKHLSKEEDPTLNLKQWLIMGDDFIYPHLHLIIILNHLWPSSTNRAYVSLMRLAKEDYALSKSTCGQGYQNAIHLTLQGHGRDCEFINNKLIFINKDLATLGFPSFQLLTDC